MVFVGNTQHNVPYMLKHADLFEELPEKYYDSAFIDRLHTYIRMFHQVRNMMEFIEMIATRKAPEDEVAVHLITCLDDTYPEKQQSNLIAIETAGATAGVNFTWEFDGTNTIHARHIASDTGWKISLDRGLDIFQKFEMNDVFNLANRLQAYRPVKAFEVTYLRLLRPAG